MIPFYVQKQSWWNCKKDINDEMDYYMLKVYDNEKEETVCLRIMENEKRI